MSRMFGADVKRRWLIPAAIVGGVAMIAGGAFAATAVSSLNAGDSMNIGCGGPSLSWSQSDATDGVASCAANPTTTTRPPPPPTTTVPPPPPPSGNCGLAQAAFCETFDQPTVNGPANSRSGQLNGVLWGTSTVGGNAPGTPVPTAPSFCNPGTNVDFPNNLEVCNGQLADTFSDGNGDAQTSMAWYPRQPFDFANRTGTVVFDVSNNTQGSHAAWPEFWMSDQPVPDPYNGIFDNGSGSLPRNGFGIKFDSCFGNVCPVPNTVGVDTVVRVSNYQVTGLNFQGDQVVAESGPGQMNHYQIAVAQNDIEVYGTDAFVPGQTVPPLRHIASVTNAGLTFTRGLIWLEDEHYGGCKFNNQCVNTFRWDNVGFDGPVLPRDLGFDVPNNHVFDPNSNNPGTPGFDNAYNIPANGSSGFVIPAVTSLDKAGGALLVFNFYSQAVIPLDVAVNGHDLSEPWPFPTNDTFTTHSIAIPVPLTDLVAGDNTLTFSAGDYLFQVLNIDLILQGAGG